jgi:hypothetical protein
MLNPDRSPGVPHYMTSETTLVVDTVSIASAAVGAELSEKSACPVGPTLILKCHGVRGGQLEEELDVVIPIYAEAHALEMGKGLIEALETIAASFTDPTVYGDDVERTTELNRLAGVIPGGPKVRCPGCGARLFGEVAIRGGCLACYPDLPPAEAVLPDLRWPDGEARP